MTTQKSEIRQPFPSLFRHQPISVTRPLLPWGTFVHPAREKSS